MNRIVLIACFAVAFASASGNRVHLEFDSQISLPDGYSKGAAADADSIITLTFALKQRNTNLLEETFWAVSDPRNPRYGQFLTVSELTDMLAPPKAAVDDLVAWLRRHDVRDISLTLNRDFVVVKVSVATAEILLETKFFEVRHVDTGRRFIRAFTPYSLPAAIAPTIDFVGGVVRLPRADAIKRRMRVSARDSLVDPAVIKQVFNIPAGLAVTNPNNSQAVSQFLEQYYNPDDLLTFQTTYNVPVQKVSKVVGYNNADDIGMEANLDIQYIIAIAQKADTWFISSNGTDNGGQEPFLEWIVALSNTTDAPLVQSISYGDTESTISRAYADRVNTEFQKFGATGRSILFSSGDDGVGCSANCKRFEPNFPASSPYVTAVGGVVLQDATSKQMTGDVISSGGFSNYYSQPSYQSAAVSAYIAGGNLPPQKFWNATGRAIPDIASFSESVPIVYQGNAIPVGGTSCAAPVVSGIITLINDARLNAGKQPMGFLNLFLYQTLASTPDAFFDITTGSNDNGCCTPGFSARVGWDPITGVGAPNFPKLLKYALAAGEASAL
eukprot:TRINITY_DN7300_c0_g2_i1.p1 TRINITY_DN7300_c0_g2~~TRINITY_DN7300_c0_g2_i1.p1  ORF type:complete len:556 (-),score=200.62 TRINITY_DN7300_c0_g2_i1:135-1802(-)